MSFFHGFSKHFSHAWRGILFAFRAEQSFRIQIAMAVVVLTLGFTFPLATWERALLLLAIAAVLVLELLNSMVERLVDLVKPRLHVYAREVKDLMAGAVLLASFCAVAIGLLVFWSHLGTILRAL